MNTHSKGLSTMSLLKYGLFKVYSLKSIIVSRNMSLFIPVEIASIWQYMGFIVYIVHRHISTVWGSYNSVTM